MYIAENECESPAEFNFVRQLCKNLDCRVYPQYEARVFRVDFVLEKGKFKVGIEIDGAEFHDRSKDAGRDQHILKNADLDGIIRFWAKDVYHYPSMIVACLAKALPFLFCPKTYERMLVSAKNEGVTQILKTGIFPKDGYHTYTKQLLHMSESGRETVMGKQECDEPVDPEAYAEARFLEIATMPDIETIQGRYSKQTKDAPLTFDDMIKSTIENIAEAQKCKEAGPH